MPVCLQATCYASMSPTTAIVLVYRCGNTSLTVPCGREKKTKPPKCSYLCKFASKCHHTNEHKCHMGECPTCVQPCLLANDVTGCEHPCQAKCHDAVKVLIVDKNFKPAGPWDVPVEKYEIQKQPHPPCGVKVPVDCIGGHENAMWPCWNSKPGSCGRPCGRALKCGHHVCEQQCHAVADYKSLAVIIKSKILANNSTWNLNFCSLSVHSKMSVALNAVDNASSHDQMAAYIPVNGDAISHRAMNATF